MRATQRLLRNSSGSSAHDGMPTTRYRQAKLQYLVIVASTVIFMGIVGFEWNSSAENHRQLQSQSSESLVVTDPPRDCSISRPEPRTMLPTIIASYPGSGAKMTWKLTRAITGVMTGDDFNHNGLVSKGQVVGIKTHYPSECCCDPDSFAPLLNVDQSVLLLRNPMNALPSYHNFFYEMEQKLKNHSTRAPVEVWIEWRDQQFEEHLATWLHVVKFWMEHHTYEHRLIITYENMIHDETGPTELFRLAKFVMRGDELASPEEDVPCVWDYIVNSRADEATRKGSKRSGGPMERPYSTDQLNRMIDELKALKNLYPAQLGQILEGYMRTLYRSQESMSTTFETVSESSIATTVE